MTKTRNMDTVLILENIRSVFNTASIFRTACAFGIERIELVGTTPAPLDRFGRVRSDFAKVSLTSENKISWALSKEVDEVVSRYTDYQICAVEQVPQSKPYTEQKYSSKKVLIFGNEVDGVSKSALSLCDSFVDIPMLGGKESLNVSIAAGVVIAFLQGVYLYNE